MELCLEGEKTIPERKLVLDDKLKELEHKIQEIQESIDYIHWKQNLYDDFLSGRKKYYSNLIKHEENDD